MLLAIDVGNTNFTCGIFDGEELVTTFRMTTKEKRTSDEYGLMFCGLVENRGVKKEQIFSVRGEHPKASEGSSNNSSKSRQSGSKCRVISC